MDTHTNYISLYSGAGGLDLGFKLAVPNARAVCYVERDAPCIALLVSHMQKNELDEAPVWTDSNTFDGIPWCGKVDWIIGGFPCQPASTAGRRAGTTDERWLWPHIQRIVSEVKPQGVFLENVRGLLSVNDGEAFEEILKGLVHLGYNIEWGILRASGIGAPHKRERVFIVATNNQCSGRERLFTNKDISGVGSWGWRGKKDLQLISNTPTQPGDRWPQPIVWRMDDGLEHRLDRLHIIGNGVVLQQVATAFVQLYERTL